MHILKRVFLTGIFVISLFVLFGQNISYAQIDDVTNSDYVQNEVIVKYKENLSPQAIQFKVLEREEIKSSFLGSFKLFFNDLGYTLRREEKPEMRLTRIQEVDAQVGVQEKQHMFEGTDEEKRNVFLITLDGTKSVEEAMSVYTSLSEVEYSEPNFILRPMEL